jgi:hypothetical protein
MQDTGDLNGFLSDAVNNEEREAGDKHFPRVEVAAFSSTVRHVLQRGGVFIDRVCHKAGLRLAETLCGVIADMQKIIRSGLRPANEHLSRIPAVDHFANIVMFDKFPPVCSRQAFIDFARKPLVIIQETFDRLLHKRFRRAALLRRDARQFSLLVRGQLHFHRFMISENRPSSNGLHGASLTLFAKSGDPKDDLPIPRCLAT